MGGPTATRRPCPLPGCPHVDALSCPVGQGVNISEPPWPVRSVSVGRARQQTIKQNWYDTSLYRSRCCPMKVSPSLRQSSCRRSPPPVTRVSKPRLALVIRDRRIEAGLPPTSMPSRFSTGLTPIWSPDIPQGSGCSRAPLRWARSPLRSATRAPQQVHESTQR
ncbi:Uncharacterised protein [Mycobacteroides abscessus]|nr:Uncharacterised protein [Mycobacteroides abscessus]